MAIKKNPKPVKTSQRKVSKLMDFQDAKSRGDSTATRTERITFSTTADVAKAVENAAYDRHMSRSKLIEAAIAEYLNL